MKILLFLMAMACVSLPAAEDEIILTSGGSLYGEVIQQSDDAITLRLGKGTMRLRRNMITDIKMAPKPAVPTPESAYLATLQPAHLPCWDDVVRALGGKPWATNLRQIPATVIDVGNLRHVPYQSYACGSGYEINVYGDLDDPACIEIGIYPPLISDDQAKATCVAFMDQLVLSSDVDRSSLHAFRFRKDSVEHAGLTIAISPETDADSYGGWWIGVCDERKLDLARAKPAELADITQRVDAPAPQATETQWNNEEIAARPARYAAPSALISGGGGSVYVRGYTRKDGTYVRPHTRRR